MARSSTRRRRPRQEITEPQAAPPPSTKTDLAVEYAYVIEDLKRIAVLAVIVIGGLVALSFFL